MTSSAYPASPAATSVRPRIILALPRPYRVLRGNHALAFLVTGQALSSLADWLLALALAVLAYNASHSATIVALLTVPRLLPYGLVLPLAGAVLDRWDRRKVMVGVGAGRALCMLCLLLVQSPTTLPLVFPIAFLSASLSTLLRPTINAALPTMVAAEERVSANSLLSQLDSLSHVAGPALGSLLVGPATRKWRLWRVVAAGAALSALATALFGLSPAGVWPFVCIAVIGVADIVVQVCATTLLQVATPPELLGRTFIAFEAALICAMLLGALTAGPLLHVLGARGATVA